MGWTHNWQRPTELPPSEFARAVEDVRKVLSATGVPLAGFAGTGQPVFAADSIVFNGPEGYNCEPFEIHQTEFDRRGRDKFWSFCKTEHAPYDIGVQAALIVLKHHLPDSIVVTSDGTDDDWTEARRICQESLGYGQEFKLSKG